jgi:hypothetical protein
VADGPDDVHNDDGGEQALRYGPISRLKRELAKKGTDFREYTFLMREFPF